MPQVDQLYNIPHETSPWLTVKFEEKFDDVGISMKRQPSYFSVLSALSDRSQPAIKSFDNVYGVLGSIHYGMQ